MKHQKYIFLFIFLIFTLGYIFFPPVSSFFHSADPQKTDILIFSPHPDDAVLCCGGLIQQAISDGKTVRIVNVTNGEGYKEAAMLLTHKTLDTLTSEDMLALGQARQEEERTAMNILKIPNSSVVFLGYPDGWLDEVYKNEGSPPFTSPFTNLSHTLDTNRSFTRVSAIADIASLISILTPAQIIIPTRTDDALDHVVTNLFVTDAIKLTEYSGTLLRYVIHPKEVSTQSATPLFTINLTDVQLQKKKQALEAYTSQMKVDSEYLHSLITNEELFY